MGTVKGTTVNVSLQDWDGMMGVGVGVTGSVPEGPPFDQRPLAGPPSGLMKDGGRHWPLNMRFGGGQFPRVRFFIFPIFISGGLPHPESQGRRSDG